MSVHALFTKSETYKVLAHRFDANAPKAQWPQGIHALPQSDGGPVFVHVWNGRAIQILSGDWLVQSDADWPGQGVHYKVYGPDAFKGWKSSAGHAAVASPA